MKYFIGIDMGTQSMRGLLFSPDGEIIAKANSEYLPAFPKPGWAECDPWLYLKALKSIITELKVKGNISENEIGCISFACIDGSIIPVDDNCMPIDNCIVWLDNRTGEQWEQLRRIIPDEEAQRITGSIIFPFLDVTKVMWLKQNKPEVYHNARYILEVNSFFVGYLTGMPYCGYCGASVSQLFDIVNMEWSERIFSAADIDIEKMCEVGSGCEVAGYVRPLAAKELGLSIRTKVAIGGSDHQIAIYGAGVCEYGQVMDTSGTCTSIATMIPDPVTDDAGTMYTHLSTLGDCWVMEQASLYTGANLRWYLDTIDRSDFNQMDREAMEVVPGSNGLIFLPYLQGQVTPKTNPVARGAFFGLTMNHDVRDMTHAVYEACTFSIRDCVERINALIGKPEIIIGSGGGTKSALWNQMKADCLGIPFRVVATSDATAVGSGMMAGIAEGIFEDVPSAIKRYIKYGQIYEPNAQKKDSYDEAYAKYLCLQNECQSLFNDFYK